MDTQKRKLLIGAHMSISKGVYNALYETKDICANTLQLFTANQRTWHTKDISKEDVDKFLKLKKTMQISHIASHSSYLINLGSNKKDLLEKSINAFEKEINRCHLLEIDYLIFHPGTAVDQEEENCLETIVKSLLSLEKSINKGKTKLLIETTAGQGNVIGYKFEHIKYIIDKVKKRINIGVCIDTAHIFAAGYDIREKKDLDKTLKEFDEIIGLKYLYAMHINDSKADFNSRKDRHENLGKGKIGLNAFKSIMQNKITKYLPKYLETPNGEKYWKEEIKLLKKFGGE